MKGAVWLVVICLGLGLGWRLWPPSPGWNPWAPLDVTAPPNLLTPYKLWRLRGDPGLCAQALASSTLKVTAQADTTGESRCPLHDVVRVSGGPIGLSSSFLATCPVAVAFALFERNVLQPAAQAAFQSRVVRVDHLGSFACRNIYNRAQGRLSQHATANALDIAGFRLADGRRVSVLKGWAGSAGEAAFLRQVRDGACTSFNTVLSPDYNAAHRNHLHLDMGPWRVCR